MSSIVDSLVIIQQAIANPPKSGLGQVGSRQYKYATLDDVLSAILPGIRAEKMFLSQGMDGDKLITRVYKGEEAMTLDVRQVDLSGTSQQQGSAETYAKRYALCSAFCLVGVDDDDGAEATRGQQSAPKPKKVDKDLQAAKDRLNAALAVYAHEHGGDLEALKRGIAKREDFSDTAEFYNFVAQEFEE